MCIADVKVGMMKHIDDPLANGFDRNGLLGERLALDLDSNINFRVLCNGSGKSRHFWEEDKDCSVCGGAGASPIRDRETGK